MNRRTRFAPLAALLLVTPTALANTHDTPPTYPGYDLVWADEFNIDGPPNPDNWSFEEGFVRNRELQWYQKENAWCEDGVLIIEGREEDRPNPMYRRGSEEWQEQRRRIEYSASSIHTWDKQEFLYGRFEIRAKIEPLAGMWPAIWTLGSEREWPGNGEIDIMEYYRGKILANAAWANPGRYKAQWDSSATPIEDIANGDVEAWAKEFHVWRMDWDSQAIKLYLDGRLLNTIELEKTINRTPDAANPFKEPHYILLNLAIGGTNGGDVGDTEFPRRYQVDYVRVYQKTEDATQAQAANAEDVTATEATEAAAAAAASHAE